MKSACVGVLLIIELKNARWNIEIREIGQFTRKIVCRYILWVTAEDRKTVHVTSGIRRGAHESFILLACYVA